MLAGREFILEGDEEASGRHDGVLLTEGNRSEIAKGYFGELERPIITWINGKGDVKPKEYRSTHSIGDDFPDATHVRLPENIDEKKGIHQEELVLAIFPAFT